MKSFVREYGVVVVIIIAGMVGYTIFHENKQEILTSSMDALRDRLVAMVEDVSGRQAVAQHFDRFQEKVLAQEVPPEEVANIAANVLNLSNSGSTITPEQATLMLDIASSAQEVTLLPTPNLAESPETDETEETLPLVAVAPTPPSAPTAVEPVALDELGDRLESMLAFDAEVHRVMNEHSADRRDMVHHIRYRVDEGLHVDINADMDEGMKERLAREVERLEKRKMVVWQRNMAAQVQAERERARRELRSVEALRRRPPPAVRVHVKELASLESLKHLESLGYRALLSDSVKHEIKVSLEGALAALGHDLEVAMKDSEGDLEGQQEALQDYLEEVQDVLEDLSEEIEDEIEEQMEGEDDN